jgi:hypothetical protein
LVNKRWGSKPPPKGKERKEKTEKEKGPEKEAKGGPATEEGKAKKSKTP